MSNNYRNKVVKRRAQKSYVPEYGLYTIRQKEAVGHQKAGAYAATLIDPWSHVGVRIPDLTSLPVATSCLQYDYDWAPVYDITGAGTSRTGLAVDLSVKTPQLQQLKGPEVTGADVAGTRVGPVVSLQSSSSWTNKVQNARLVSAGVRVRFAGNDSNSAGVVKIVYRPSVNWGQINPTSAVPSAVLTDPNAQSYAYVGPVKDGCSATYRPADSFAFSMLDVVTSTTSFGQFVVSISGNTTPPTLSVSVVMNFEYLPASEYYGDTLLSCVANAASFDKGLEIASTIDACRDGEKGFDKASKAAQTLISTGSYKRSSKRRKLAWK